MLERMKSPVFDSVKIVIRKYFGENTEIMNKQSVYGGDINESFCLKLSNGESVFLKKNAKNKMRMFLCEAHGLKALSEAKKIGVPKVYGVGQDKEKGYSFLLMEFLNQGIKCPNYWETFGRELAMLHLSPTKHICDGKYGFTEDNYISFFIMAIPTAFMPT